MKLKQSLKSNDGESLDDQEEQLSINCIKSDSTELYKAFMDKIKIDDLSTIKEKLMKNGIEYVDKFHSLTSVKLIQIDLDSAVLEVTLGNFKAFLTVYRMILNEEEILEQSRLGSGSYAIVYKLRVGDQYYACKSVEAMESKNLFQLVYIYEEYIFTKIAGIFGIGPQIAQPFQYDIICFRNRAIFTMELCATDFSMPFSAIGTIGRENLLYGLKLLHCLKICHGDIKVENIAYSQNRGRFIFIDFGLARVVQEDVGFKSFTSFFGTFQYTSPEMKKSYFLKGPSFVDLFYNDIYCIELSFQKFDNLFTFQQAVQIFTDQISHCNATAIFSIRYLLFRKQIEMALQTIVECKSLPKTVLKIFIEQFCVKRNNYLLGKTLQMLKIRVEESLSNELDDIFNAYFQKLYNQQLENYFISIVSFVESDLSMELIWLKKCWMDEITLFLEAELKIQQITWTQKDFILRAKLIDKIFQCLDGKCILIEKNLSFLFKFRTVLSALLKYYEKEQNIRMLQIIRDLFIKIDDFSNQYRVQNILLSLYIKQGKERSELALKKLQFFLFRKLQIDFFYYPASEILLIDGSFNQQFFKFNKPMNPLETLYYKLVNLGNSEVRDEQKEISQIFDEAFTNQTNEEYQQLILDFQVLYNSKRSLKFLINNYKRAQNKRIKFVLKKMFCFSCIGTLLVFTLFNEDLYLSQIRSYLEAFKNIFHLEVPEIILATNQYFVIYYTQLQYMPEQRQFTNLLRKQKNQHLLFSAFTDQFISYYKSSTFSTATFTLENIKVINEIMLFYFMEHKYSTTQCRIQLLQIFEECKQKLKGIKLHFINETIIKFVEILFFHFWNRKVAIQRLLSLIKTIEYQQIINVNSFHSILQIMALLLILETQAHKQLEELEDTIIEIHKTCMAIGQYRVFEDFRVTFNVLQQILAKRNCCELEFRFFITISKICNKKRRTSLNYFLYKTNDRYHYFVTNYTCESLLKTVPIMCEEGRIQIMTQRLHLGGFYFQIYLKIEKLLSLQAKKRLLILIAYGIPNIILIQKKNLVIPLFYKKQMKIFEGKSPRKVRICKKIRKKYDKFNEIIAHNPNNFKVGAKTEVIEKMRLAIQRYNSLNIA